MKYKNVLNRRTLLKGLGGAVVGLPFLEEMTVNSVFAQGAEPPKRGINIFFGLGFQRDIQKEGFRAGNGWMSPMEPFMRYEKKLAFLRGVNQIRANGNSNAHYDGSSGAFTGTGMKNKNTAGGISIDEALRRHAHPNGMPNGMLDSLSAGTWWRRSDSTCRYIHSRKPDGSIVNRPYETPRTLFNQVFGAGLPTGGGNNNGGGDQVDPDEALDFAMRNSVLDSLVEQYKHYQSDAGGLGRASRAKIADHLDHIRALEQKVASNVPKLVPGSGGGGGGGGASCSEMREPGNSKLPHGNPKNGDGTKLSNDGDGIDITLQELTGEFRLMAQIYAMAYTCDRARFGSLVFQSGGERIRLSGDYTYENTKHRFDDRKIRKSGGSSGCSHEFWHKYSDGKENAQVRAHQHLMFREISYFLGLLDAARDENGGTLLDNSMITISTESGDGRHRSAEWELGGVFHAVSGSAGRIKTGAGSFIDVDDHASNVYNTILRSHGVSGLIGDKKGDIGKIKA